MTSRALLKWSDTVFFLSRKLLAIRNGYILFNEMSWLSSNVLRCFFESFSFVTLSLKITAAIESCFNMSKAELGIQMSISQSFHNNLLNLMTASNVEGLNYTFLYFSSDQMTNRICFFLSWKLGWLIYGFLLGMFDVQIFK